MHRSSSLWRILLSIALLSTGPTSSADKATFPRPGGGRGEGGGAGVARSPARADDGGAKTKGPAWLPSQRIFSSERVALFLRAPTSSERLAPTLTPRWYHHRPTPHHAAPHGDLLTVPTSSLRVTHTLGALHELKKPSSRFISRKDAAVREAGGAVLTKPAVIEQVPSLAAHHRLRRRTPTTADLAPRVGVR